MTASTLARPAMAAAAISAVLIALTGCVANTPAGNASTKLTVDSTGTECLVSANTAVAGDISFTVTNSSDAETEFYFLGANGKLISEVEHLGPDTTRSMVVSVKAGKYFTACKNGAGDVVGKTRFTVTD
jgi:iron uptake system component EfeO